MKKENIMLQYTVMRKLADIAEKKDVETSNHLLRIQHYCRFIAETLSVQEKYKYLITDEFIEDIYYSSPLHDIGKVGIEDQILLKPGKLTQDEMAVMKTHILIGAEILKGPAFLKMGQDIVRYHHEKWDGTGYPEGLKGEEIPLPARIVKLADVYDALVSKRVYKESFNQEKAESIIQEGIGSHFDPDICNVFMEYRKKFIEIRDRFQEETGKPASGVTPEEMEMIDCTGCAGCDYDTCRRENTMSVETSSIEGQATELVISERINTTEFTLTDLHCKRIV